MAASAPARLITIPISHYCEKARWALDRAGIAYREERHIQIVHRVASRRAGGGGTVPVLVTAEGVFTQSADILAYADRHTEPAARLYPDALRSEVVGAGARLRRATSGPRAGAGCTSTSCRAARPRAGLQLRRRSRRGSGARSRCCSARCRATSATCSRSGPRPGRRPAPRCSATFDAVAARLDDGRRYLCGDAFTAADLAFAALAAPVLVPPEYGVPLPQPDELPPDMAAERARLPRPSRRGLRVRLFREER